MPCRRFLRAAWAHMRAASDGQTALCSHVVVGVPLRVNWCSERLDSQVATRRCALAPGGGQRRRAESDFRSRGGSATPCRNEACPRPFPPQVIHLLNSKNEDFEVRLAETEAVHKAATRAGRGAKAPGCCAKFHGCGRQRHSSRAPLPRRLFGMLRRTRNTTSPTADRRSPDNNTPPQPPGRKPQAHP